MYTGSFPWVKRPEPHADYVPSTNAQIAIRLEPLLRLYSGPAYTCYGLTFTLPLLNNVEGSCPGLGYYFRICLEGQRKTKKNPVSIPDVRAKIRTGKLATVSFVCYCLNQRFSNFFQVGTTFISQNVLRTTLLLGLSISLGLP